MRKPEDFCLECGVHASLHLMGDGSPEDCKAADVKASSLERNGRALIPSEGASDADA